MSIWEAVTRGMTWAVLRDSEVQRQHIVLTLRIQRDAETGAFVSLCEELGVSSFGESVAEAIELVVEATLLYLNTLESEGELGRVFDEQRVDVRSGAPSANWERANPGISEPAGVQPKGVVTTRVLVSQV